MDHPSSLPTTADYANQTAQVNLRSLTKLEQRITRLEAHVTQLALLLTRITESHSHD